MLGQRSGIAARLSAPPRAGPGRVPGVARGPRRTARPGFSATCSRFAVWRATSTPWRSLRAGRIRVLSVGCSTGEEVYSLAIILREAGLEPSRFLILGTDVSRRALELAQDGRFTSRSFRDPTKRSSHCATGGVSVWASRGRSATSCEPGSSSAAGNLAQPDFLAGESPSKSSSAVTC